MVEYEERYWYDFEDPTGHKIIDKKSERSFNLETVGDFRLLTDKMNELSFERDSYMSDAIKFEKECKRLYNNLRLTTGDWKYEELMHKQLEKENDELKFKNKQLEKEISRLKCINNQLEKKYEDKGFSLAYNMRECE